MMLELRFHDPAFEGESTSEKYDLLLGIVATFELIVNGAAVYEEEMFPIAELRTTLLKWLKEAMSLHEDFDFESIESEERGLVWIRWTEGEGWKVGSVFEEYREPKAFSDDEIRGAIERFVSEVDQWAATELEVKLPERP